MKPLNIKNEFLPRSSASLLRVVFEALVLIHHLFPPYTSTGAVISSALGPIAVGGFVFLSGYGIGCSFTQKGDEYLKKLLKVRVPRTYAILLIADLCYLALYLAMGGAFDSAFSAIASVLYLPVFKGFIALSHWIYFLADLLIYYLLFLLFAVIFKKSRNRLIWTAAAILIVDVIIIAVLSFVNHKTGSARYLRACLCFPVGLICSAFFEKLASILSRNKIPLVISTLLIGVVLMILDCGSVTEYVLPIFTALAFVAMLYGINTESRALDYLSGLVIYVYVSHEFFLTVCRSLFSTLHTHALGLIVFVCSALFAILLDFIVRKCGKIKL